MTIPYQKTAQFLYDLREVTGFISGTDLHELFRQLVGDPSPPGQTEIDLSQAERLSSELSSELDCTLTTVAENVRKYTGHDTNTALLRAWGPDQPLRHCSDFVEQCCTGLAARAASPEN